MFAKLDKNISKPAAKWRDKPSQSLDCYQHNLLPRKGWSLRSPVRGAFTPCMKHTLTVKTGISSTNNKLPILYSWTRNPCRQNIGRSLRAGVAGKTWNQRLMHRNSISWQHLARVDAWFCCWWQKRESTNVAAAAFCCWRGDGHEEWQACCYAEAGDVALQKRNLLPVLVAAEGAWEMLFAVDKR